jgi:hypothetical protein
MHEQNSTTTTDDEIRDKCSLHSWLTRKITPKPIKITPDVLYLASLLLAPEAERRAALEHVRASC